MPNLDDIVQVAEALEKSPVVVVRDRCVAVRNRNASCRRCVDACAFDAIEVGPNKISLSGRSCIGCGACVAACPTEALVPLAPNDGELLSDAASTIQVNDGRAVIACARMAAKRIADPARFAEVACLPRARESLMLMLAQLGASEILLVDGSCETCKHRACIPAIEAALDYANAIFEAQGADVRVRRQTGFPDELKVEDANGLYGGDRRGFISDALGMAKETALVAARASLGNELGLKAEEPSAIKQLRVGASGTLPLIEAPHHMALINAMDYLGAPQVDTIRSRQFGTIDIDIGKCNSCGMCAVFCPTGAIKRDPADKRSAPLRYLEFSAVECVQCGLCADVCWKGALTLSDVVTADELFDFEPRTFTVSPTVSPSPHGNGVSR